MLHVLRRRMVVDFGVNNYLFSEFDSIIREVHCDTWHRDIHISTQQEIIDWL